MIVPLAFALAAVPAGMVRIPGGTFRMGAADGPPDESPVRTVRVSSFLMDRRDVTNAEFARFVRATGYRTVAERPLDPAKFPGVPKNKLKPGGVVFQNGWTYVPGANWRHPDGPASSIRGKDRHPVVQVAWDDAAAYARWAGKRLPTEAQWEYAARGGRPPTRYTWGDAPFSPKRPQANIWQGPFPAKNLLQDGYRETSPVGSFPPNPFGLYDMAGNVWEWCADWYRPDAYARMAARDPQGPSSGEDPDEPGVPKRVLRGGSFMCADCYCKGYRPSARMKSSPDTGLFHAGFRCVVDLPESSPQRTRRAQRPLRQAKLSVVSVPSVVKKTR